MITNLKPVGNPANRPEKLPSICSELPPLGITNTVPYYVTPSSTNLCKVPKGNFIQISDNKH